MDALITALNFPNSSKTRPTSKNQLTTDAMSQMKKIKKNWDKIEIPVSFAACKACR